MRSLIAIPARLASTRLPEKLLRADTGMPLIAHTVRAARRASEIGCGPVWVVCDDRRIADAATAAGAEALCIEEYCNSGTERIARALHLMPEVDFVVNLQADEPEMPADWIEECLRRLEASDAAVSTIAVRAGESADELDSPNVVKVVTDHAGNALYFSRALIPFVRAGGVNPVPRALRHVGLYAYRAEFLKSLETLPASSLEDAECLEQLRFLQCGVKMRVVEVSAPLTPFTGIDSFEDYEHFVTRQRSANS
jgi:3-deoxy-manno-octulosonate cytidylyltransferase (CMP-KDO synthetase)